MTYILLSLSAASLITAYILFKKSRQYMAETWDILTEVDRIWQEVENSKPKLSVAGWKLALEGFEERQDYETCNKIKTSIEGKEDHEFLNIDGLYIVCNPNDGIQVVKL